LFFSPRDGCLPIERMIFFCSANEDAALYPTFLLLETVVVLFWSLLHPFFLYSTMPPVSRSRHLVLNPWLSQPASPPSFRPPAVSSRRACRSWLRLFFCDSACFYLPVSFPSVRKSSWLQVSCCQPCFMTAAQIFSFGGPPNFLQARCPLRSGYPPF